VKKRGAEAAVAGMVAKVRNAFRKCFVVKPASAEAVGEREEGKLVNLNIHFDLAELVIYTATAGVVWHLIGNLVQGAALHLNAALLRKAELKKKAVEVALAEQQGAGYQARSAKEYERMQVQHAATRSRAPGHAAGTARGEELMAAHAADQFHHRARGLAAAVLRSRTVRKLQHGALVLYLPRRQEPVRGVRQERARVESRRSNSMKHQGSCAIEADATKIRPRLVRKHRQLANRTATLFTFGRLLVIYNRHCFVDGECKRCFAIQQKKEKAAAA
jgi:hypothetical protein